MKNYLFASIFIFVLALTSCRTTKATTPAELLTGTTWELASLNGNVVTPEIYSRGLPYITFGDDNKLTGSSGCNSFSAPYNFTDAKGIVVGQVMATKMFCEGIDEKSFLEALDKATTIKAKSDKLILLQGDNEVMAFVPKK